MGVGIAADIEVHIAGECAGQFQIGGNSGEERTKSGTGKVCSLNAGLPFRRGRVTHQDAGPVVIDFQRPGVVCAPADSAVRCSRFNAVGSAALEN